MGLFGIGKENAGPSGDAARGNEGNREEVERSGARRIAMPHLRVTHKGNLTNPFQRHFEEEKKWVAAGASPEELPTLSSEDFEALSRADAHDKGPADIVAVDFSGYVERDGVRRFEDLVQARGLGGSRVGVRHGEVMMVALGKEDRSPASP